MRHIFAAVLASAVVSAAPAGFNASFAQQSSTNATPISQPISDRQNIGGIAAIVNDFPISQADVIERARLTIMTLGARPNPQQQQKIIFQSLEQLIDERLQIQEAGEYDLVIDDGRVDIELNQVAQQLGLTGASFEAQLAQAGISPASLREQLRAEVAWQEIIRGLYGSGIRISKNRIKAERAKLEENLAEKTYRISEIFLFTGGDASVQSEALNAAGTIVEQINQGANFAAVAQRLSSAPTAATGGDKGWVTLDSLPPEIAEPVGRAAEQTVLAPIPSESGVYIISLNGIRNPQNSTTLVSFAQIIDSSNSLAALDNFILQANSCEALKANADSNANISVFIADDVSLSALTDQMQTRLSGLDVGGLSDSFTTPNGLARMYVCDRRSENTNLPSDEEIEGSLRQRELAMIADRSLRNLRREATIIRR